MSGHSHYAGMNYYNHWIPAYAGMTGVVQVTQDNEIPGMPKSPNNAPVVIPAKARLQGCRW